MCSTHATKKHAINYFKNIINYKPKTVVKEESFEITCDLANFSLSRAIIYLRKRFKARTCGSGSPNSLCL